MTFILNADPHGRIALQSYDPVAFHTTGEALKGHPSIIVEYGGYKFSLSSKENKAAFEKEPEKYLPDFGGYCAYGVAHGLLFPVEIDTWEIIDGHLVFQYNEEIKYMFEADKEKYLSKAKAKWAKIEPKLIG